MKKSSKIGYNVAKDLYGSERAYIRNIKDSGRFLVIHYPEITIRNKSLRLEEVVKDTYVEISLNTMKIRIARATYTALQAARNYVHPHVKTAPPAFDTYCNYIQSYKEACLGDNKIIDDIIELNRDKLSETNWIAFFRSLEEFLQTESKDNYIINIKELRSQIFEQKMETLQMRMRFAHNSRRGQIKWLNKATSEVNYTIDKYIDTAFSTKLLRFSYIGGVFLVNNPTSEIADFIASNIKRDISQLMDKEKKDGLDREEVKKIKKKQVDLSDMVYLYVKDINGQKVIPSKKGVIRDLQEELDIRLKNSDLETEIFFKGRYVPLAIEGSIEENLEAPEAYVWPTEITLALFLNKANERMNIAAKEVWERFKSKK